MKNVCFFFSLFFFTQVGYSQFQNQKFDDWVLIDSLGENYYDPEFWQTNNGHDLWGHAYTPIAQINVLGDRGVSITTTSAGIDGVGSGLLTQVIGTDKLGEISYKSKCDSLFSVGGGIAACVVNIYDLEMNVIYTDSIKEVETAYTVKTIDIGEIGLANIDFINVEFVASGGSTVMDTLVKAYSVFNLLNVNAKYLTGISEANDNVLLNAFPNPFQNFIKIELDGRKLDRYQLFDAKGILVKDGKSPLIETETLINGIYFLSIQNGQKINWTKMVKI